MAQEIADSTLLDTWASGGNIIEPDISKIIEGWQLGEQPPHEYMNWLQNTFGSKLNHILKNGIATWNNTTQYLAGSSVQHNGNIWLCKATNTNSAPTDANANWKRTITVESLTTVLGGYVALTGNQTIAGVKTFSSSPIVPTPTAGTQAATKAYVDSVSTLVINTLTNKTTPVDADELVIADSGTSFSLKKLSWANLKATLLSYFDTLYSRTTAIFGIGQTVQNVTASRSADVTYTNTTGKPIFITITGAGAGGAINRYGNLTVDGFTVSTMGTTSSTQNFSCSFVVPNGSTYKYTQSNMPIQFWHELR